MRAVGQKRTSTYYEGNDSYIRYSGRKGSTRLCVSASELLLFTFGRLESILVLRIW